MKLTIEKRHLEAARAVDWSTETCVLQQALKEKGLKLYDDAGCYLLVPDYKAKEIMRYFDAGFYEKVIALLPAEVEFTEVKKDIES